jgi:hypothetical protein
MRGTTSKMTDRDDAQLRTPATTATPRGHVKKMTVGRRALYFDGLWLPSSLMSVKTSSMTPVGFVLSAKADLTLIAFAPGPEDLREPQAKIRYSDAPLTLESGSALKT